MDRTFIPHFFYLFIFSDLRPIEIIKNLKSVDHRRSTFLFQYIHNRNDVISGADSIHDSLIESVEIIQNEVELHETIASDSLRSLSIARRKCLFFEEKYLQFFPVYTKNLCNINCRIQAALRLCGCVPFFYNLSKLFYK